MDEYAEVNLTLEIELFLLLNIDLTANKNFSILTQPFLIVLPQQNTHRLKIMLLNVVRIFS